MTYLSINLPTQLLAALFLCANWPQPSTRLGGVGFDFRLDTFKNRRYSGWCLKIPYPNINFFDSWYWVFVSEIFSMFLRPYSFISSQMKIRIGMTSLSNHYGTVNDPTSYWWIYIHFPHCLHVQLALIALSLIQLWSLTMIIHDHTSYIR